MRYVMTVSPDFPPAKIAGWYIFNTWLQRQLGEHIHLELYPDFASQRTAILNQEIDLIYANPFDAAMLVVNKLVAIAAPLINQMRHYCCCNGFPGAAREDLPASALRPPMTDVNRFHDLWSLLIFPMPCQVNTVAHALVAGQLLRLAALVSS